MRPQFSTPPTTPMQEQGQHFPSVSTPHPRSVPGTKVTAKNKTNVAHALSKPAVPGGCIREEIGAEGWMDRWTCYLRPQEACAPDPAWVGHSGQECFIN